MCERAQTQFRELLLLVLLSFLWGGSFTLIKVAVESVPPATMVAGRLAIAALLLLLLVRLQRIRLPRDPAVWRALVVQGLLQSALPFTLISWGEKHIDSSLAGLLNATPPLFAFLIGFFLLRERDAILRKMLGVAVGFLGVLAALGPDALAGADRSLLGQLAVTGASLSYAIAAIYARRFSGQSALLTAACSMAIATVIMLPLALYFDRPWTLAPAAEAVWSIAALGLLSTALAMVLYFRLVRTLGALGVTSGSYLRAGFSVALGALVLNEALHLGLWLGLVLILLGVAIVTGQVRMPRRGVKAA